MRWIVALAAVSCGHGADPQSFVAIGSTFPFAERIGWVHGPCLAIANSQLSRGMPVALVITDEPQRVEQARIGEPTDSAADCPALAAGRAKTNGEALSFYVLGPRTIATTELGLGIVGPPQNPRVVNGRAQVDLNHDGHNELFTSCATSEGIRFAVWTDQANRGEPRWSGYEYLNYDLTPTCR
jgi:hypothetical protein